MKALMVFMALVAYYPSPAYAYLDPGTGTMIVQVIIAGIAGALVSIKVYWVQLSVWIKKLRSGKLND